MQIRRARHQSEEFADLTTAQAIVVVAERMCAELGPGKIKLADIANELGIETPAIYRHYKGRDGVIAALGEQALTAEIETFDGVADLPFREAVLQQADRMFALYTERPGLARFLMVDLAEPRGVHIFDGNRNNELVGKLFELERELLDRGVAEGAIRPMSLITFIASRLGPALVAMSFRDFGPSESGDLKREYLETVEAIFRERNQ